MPHSLAYSQRAFTIHAAAYVVGLIVMGIINYLIGPPYWIIWPFLGWSVGLFCHWFFVLGPGSKLG